MRPSRRQAGRRGSEAGTTLVEMLVATVMLTMVLVMATTGFVTLMHTNNTATSRTSTQADNRAGLEFVTRLLREATYGERLDRTNSTIVTDAEPTQLVFYSRLGTNALSTQNLVLFDPVAHELRWGQSQPTCPALISSPCSYSMPAATTVLVRFMRNAPAGSCAGENPDGAVFRYFINGVVDTNPGVLLQPAPADATGQVLGVRLKDVSSVELELWTDQIPNVPNPGCESLSSVTSLRNRLV